MPPQPSADSAAPPGEFRAPCKQAAQDIADVSVLRSQSYGRSDITMVVLSLFVSLLLAATTFGAPVSRVSFPPIPSTSRGLLCGLPLPPLIKKLLCPPTNSGSDVVVNTPLGAAHGVVDTNAVRFAVKYGSAARWQPSSVVTSWQLPCVSSHFVLLCTCSDWR